MTKSTKSLRAKQLQLECSISCRLRFYQLIWNFWKTFSFVISLRFKTVDFITTKKMIQHRQSMHLYWIGIWNLDFGPNNFHLIYSLLTLEGSEWKDRRVKLSPIFTSGKMKLMFEIVDSIGDKLINVLEKMILKTNDIELKSLSSKYASDVIGNCAFGLDCHCE